MFVAYAAAGLAIFLVFQIVGDALAVLTDVLSAQAPKSVDEIPEATALVTRSQKHASEEATSRFLADLSRAESPRD